MPQDIEKTPSQKLYTPREVMRIFRISRNTVTNWMNKGILQRVQPAGSNRVYVNADQVEELINASTETKLAHD